MNAKLSRSLTLPGAHSPLDSLSRYWPAILACAMLAFTAFTLSYRAAPLRFYESRIEPAELHAGDVALLHRTVEWLRTCRIEVSEFWVQKDETGNPTQVIKTVELKVIPEPASTGRFTSTRRIKIPEILTSGLWYYRAVDRGVCFPWEQWFPLGPYTVDTPVTILPK